MKKFFLSFFTFVSLLAAVEVIEGGKIPENCQKLATVRVGNAVQTYHRSQAEELAKAEARKLGANKMTLTLIPHQHQKLGLRYTATADAYQCR
ncbi:MAG: hypothetical protein NZM25_02700 [Leptospiraceae bacterium]|nr:hypothetical protein [Leptospiraceae bacterium]MDW8307178.1 hypothetical protein [Leptospiraceae bacterium]